MTFSASGRIDWIRSAIDEHQGRLIRLALRITGDLESARDVVQDTFLRLCREDPEHVDHLPGWLFRVCRNRALDVRRKEGPLQPLDDAASSSLEVAGPGPEDALGKDEESRRIHRALADLGTSTQEVMRLRFQDELSYKEISAITGHSVSHVGVLIHTGIKQLRQRLRPSEPNGRARA
jgi:RNA polymerase sigma factor (sigma-70 family)